MTNVDDESLRRSHDAAAAQIPLKSDAQLLRLMQMGDAEAWQELYQRLLPSAWRLAWQLVGDRQIAEDLVADCLLALCRQANDLDPDSIKLFGWLRGVIRHKAMDHHRAQARRSAALDQRAALQATGEAQKHSDNRPAARSERAEQINDVIAVLEGLDETRRQCLEWKYLERLSVREMAARLDLTEKAVESVLYRARLEFRERFKQREQSYNTTAIPNQPVEPSARSSDQ